MVAAGAALQIAVDYLDSLGEDAGDDPLADGLRLHGALAAAVAPGIVPDDPYRFHPRGEDGGYLAELVAACAGASSVLPRIGSELHQRVCELAMEAAGPQAGAALAAIGLDGEALDRGARAMARHLCLRAASIYSGTSETQRNLIARQLIG